MTLAVLALQFLLCAALIASAGYVLCQSADRIVKATGLTGGWIGLAAARDRGDAACAAVVMSGLVMIGPVMRPQGRALRLLSWISVDLLATYLLNAVLVFLHGGA